MTKKEIAKKLATETGMIQKDAINIVDKFTEIVVDILKQGDCVSLSGFCTFKVVDKPEMDRRNPKTGEKIRTPAHKIPVAKFSNIFKEDLQKN